MGVYRPNLGRATPTSEARCIFLLKSLFSLV
jgi:hypothetical protein